MVRSRRHLLPLACAWLAMGSGCRDRRAPPPEPARAGVERLAAPAPAKLDLTSWVGMRPSELGCWMERSFGYRDPAFGCTAPERPTVSDPCEEGFDDGPSVPAEVANGIHPLLREVELAWERGALQSATFHFGPGVDDADLARVLGVGRSTLETAASAGPGACGAPCYELVVFPPSEVDCDGEDEEE